VLSFYLSGCLYTTHHFNTGALLLPGETTNSLGFGTQAFVELKCSDVDMRASGNAYGTVQHDKNGKVSCLVQSIREMDTLYRYDSTWIPVHEKRNTVPNFSFGRRIGVREAWGPFTGVDLGWRIEAPTGPFSAEFDARFGLPIPEKLNGFKHSLSLGWDIGAYVDNSWFGEYAVSYALPWLRPFGQFRATYLATQPPDLEAGVDDLRLTPYRRWVGQFGLGSDFQTRGSGIIPKHILPLFLITTPGLPFIVEPFHPPEKHFAVNFVLGMSW